MVKKLTRWSVFMAMIRLMRHRKTNQAECLVMAEDFKTYDAPKTEPFDPTKEYGTNAQFEEQYNNLVKAERRRKFKDGIILAPPVVPVKWKREDAGT